MEYRRVAVGDMDYVLYWRTHPWDHAPGSLIVEEAGGSYVELKASSSDDGEPLSNVVFGRPGLVERIAATLAG